MDKLVSLDIEVPIAPLDPRPSHARYRDYGFCTAAPSHIHHRLMPTVFELCEPLVTGPRVLDVGCGNGSAATPFLAKGCDFVGIDLSESGIALAREAYGDARFEVLPADENILRNLACEPFDVVISTEVVEHLYAPRSYARGCWEALRPGGRFICSTPYHGYAKNLVFSVLNRWDRHADPLWDGGHIKLWSRRTLSQLLLEAGFKNLQFRGAGRVPGLWMTMIMSGDRPAK